MPHHRMGRGPCGLICWCITAVLCCSICQKDQENREAEGKLYLLYKISCYSQFAYGSCFIPCAFDFIYIYIYVL